MTKAEQIRQELKRMASQVGPDTTMVAQVKSVNEPDLTCDLYDDDNEVDFTGVLLRPVVDGSESLTIIPKVDSWVLAIRLEDSDDWIIIYTCEIEKFHLKCDQIVINGGEKGGLVNWPDAKNQLDKTNDVVSALVSAFTNWVVTPNDGGAALKTAFSTAIAGKNVGSFENLVDDKVKH